MSGKKILLIEPKGIGSNVFENYMNLPLTGLLYLGTILKNWGHDVTIINEKLSHDVDPFEIHADIYCITSLTVTTNRAIHLANQFKKLYPKSKVIIGGIHATLLPENFSNVADQIVIGEAENIIVDLIEGKIEERIVHGSPVTDMDSLPMIDYSLLMDYDKLDIIPIITSRGCPFDCDFCTVTKIFGKKFRMQSPKRILEEIKNALSFFQTRNFFFYDDNFTANKKRILQFTELLFEENIKIEWSAQVRSDIAKDPQLIKKLAKAGCDRVFVGFESIDDTTLKELNKSQTRKDIEESIEILQRFGIKIHGMFMFGEDNDKIGNISNTVDFAISHDIDTVQFMILTPFPGTKTYKKITDQNRLFHKNWDYYDGMYIVFQPKNMNPTRLQHETINAYKKFYSLNRTIVDAFYFMFNIFLDALVWNFRRAHRYNFDTIFLRIASKFIVKRYSAFYNASYLKFLENIEGVPDTAESPVDKI